MRREASLKLFVALSVLFVLLWTIVPFFWMLWASFMTDSELSEGIVQNIDEPTLEHYKRIFGHADKEAIFGGQTKLIGQGFLNSLIVSLPVAIIGTAIATLAGYAFGRFHFPAKTGLLFGLLLTRVLPPVAILIPYFTMFRTVGLVGDPGGLILTYLTGIIPLLSWVLMGYFATLPLEVERAARIDGCSRLKVLWYVIIPMAAPGHQRRLHHRLPLRLERTAVRDHPGGRHPVADPLAGAARDLAVDGGGLLADSAVLGGERALHRAAADPRADLPALHHAPQHRRSGHRPRIAAGAAP